MASYSISKYKTTLKTLLQFFFFGGLLVMIFYLPFTSDWRIAPLIRSFAFDGLLFVLLGFGNGYLADKIPISWVEKPRLRFVVSLVATFVLTIFIAALVQILIYHFGYGISLKRIFENTNKEYYYNVLLITLVVSTFMHGRAFLLELRSSIEEREALKRANLTSQYENLKKQVNPHFLFNSLNVLTALVHKNADLSEQFIRQLSAVYRYVLEVGDKELIELDQEVEALQSYIFLLKIRFGKAFQLSIDLPHSDHYLIPPLVLQMLVENAIKHNIVSKEYPLQLTIKLLKEEESIEVKNNLQHKEQNEESMGIGLNNIDQRYRHVTGQSINTFLKAECFIVRLPLIHMT